MRRRRSACDISELGGGGSGPGLDTKPAIPRDANFGASLREVVDENSLQGEVVRFLNAWLGVRQLIQAANFNRFQKAGLSATQFMALNLIPSEGSITIGELARRLNLKPATVAKTIDSLETRKMVKRSRDAADRRVTLLTITKAGAKMQNSASGQFREYIAGLFEAMSEGERRSLVDGLESLIRQASHIK